MITVVLALSAIALFLSFVYLQNKGLRFILTILSGFIFLSSIACIGTNDVKHLGMHEVTITKKRRIYSAIPKININMIIFKNLGTQNKESIQLYANHPNQKKPSHTSANDYVTNKVVRTNNNKAYVKTRNKVWEYQNSTIKFWFKVPKENKEIIKQTNIFYIPNNWMYISANKASQLKKQMVKLKRSPKLQKMIKNQTKQYVAQQMQLAIQKDPSISQNKSKQKQLEKQLTKQLELKVMQSMLK